MADTFRTKAKRISAMSSDSLDEDVKVVVPPKPVPNPRKKAHDESWTVKDLIAETTRRRALLTPEQDKTRTWFRSRDSQVSSVS
jgi:hypothetical protein